MRQVLARPEQTQSFIEIINHASRDAALVPTDTNALDITGDALRRLVSIVGREVTHD